jgi:hypothetical protein
MGPRPTKLLKVIYNLNLYILVYKSTHEKNFRSWVMRWKTCFRQNWKFANKKMFEIPEAFDKSANIFTYFYNFTLTGSIIKIGSYIKRNQRYMWGSIFFINTIISNKTI